MMTLAEKLFQTNPNLTEAEVLAQGFDLMKKEEGLKTARYYFWYHEDFASDFVSEYFWLQKNMIENGCQTLTASV